MEVDDTKSILIDEIDTESTIDKMDDVIIRDIPKQDSNIRDIFLSCIVDETERTFVFNENKQSFYEAIGLDKLNYSVKFSKTHIFASNEERDEILINRVSGTTTFTRDSKISEGKCSLLDQTKF